MSGLCEKGRGAAAPLLSYTYRLSYTMSSIPSNSQLTGLILRRSEVARPNSLLGPRQLTCSQRIGFITSVGRTMHRYCGGHGFDSRCSP